MDEKKEVYFIEEQEEVMEEANEGELLVSWRALMALKEPRKSKGRTSFSLDVRSKGRCAP